MHQAGFTNGQHIEEALPGGTSLVATVLTLIAVLGGGALLIATWVFANAARRYVNGDDVRDEYLALQSDLSPYRRNWVTRANSDRRRNRNPAIFPITVNGVRIDKDRRVNPDRRRVA